VETPAGAVPTVASSWTREDRWGTVKARSGIGRMDYRVVPGLYGLGHPDRQSPVLVTANYKMSFDRLRRAVPDLDAWILVLDTDGINVWCAAGRGTFGTDELVRSIEAGGLERVVDHRELILPQLAAPGVAAHEVAPRSGFEVVWGPILAEDLPAFLAAGRVATPQMRRKRFPLNERVALIPMELVPAAKPALPIVVAALLLGGLGSSAGFWAGVLDRGFAAALALLAAVAAGAIVTPLLLPWLPGRAFSFKGGVAGAVMIAVVLLWSGGGDPTTLLRLEAVGWLLIGTALAAFLAMNFTGSSTFTSLSGVRREMRFAVPLQIVGAVAGLGLWIGSMWLPGGSG
jgi:acetyl-CoA decarbonylase/synthase complex subunit gamma